MPLADMLEDWRDVLPRPPNLTRQAGWSWFVLTNTLPADRGLILELNQVYPKCSFPLLFLNHGCQGDADKATE